MKITGLLTIVGLFLLVMTFAGAHDAPYVMSCFHCIPSASLPLTAMAIAAVSIALLTLALTRLIKVTPAILLNKYSVSSIVPQSLDHFDDSLIPLFPIHLMIPLDEALIIESSV